MRRALSLFVVLQLNTAQAQPAPISEHASSQDNSQVSTERAQLDRASEQPERTPTLESRSAFQKGLEALRAERWDDAEAEFRRSLALVPRASAQYNLAFVLFRRGRPRESAELLHGLIDRAEGDGRYRTQAQALLPLVSRELSHLNLTVVPRHAELRVDGELRSLSGGERFLTLDPGVHRIALSAPGFATRYVELALDPQALVTQSISLLPTLQEAARPAPTPAVKTPVDSAPKTASRAHALGPWLVLGVA